MIAGRFARREQNRNCFDPLRDLVRQQLGPTRRRSGDGGEWLHCTQSVWHINQSQPADDDESRRATAPTRHSDAFPAAFSTPRAKHQVFSCSLPTDRRFRYELRRRLTSNST